MNILIYSRVFLPSFGGLEKMMHLIASELSAAGHAVTVATMTPAAEEPREAYRVIRLPSIRALARASRRADVCLMANISLRATPLFLMLGRKVVISHQGWYAGEGTFDIRATLKDLVTHFTYNIFCSEAVDKHVRGSGIVIPNAYNDDVFWVRDYISKNRDIAFLGRLVSDKGCDLLLEAMANLRGRGLHPTLSIIGAGPELENLKMLTSDLGLTGHVKFCGKLEGEELAGVLAGHRILAVPSIWEEPFGIVALEGAACGCVVIGTEGGGLPEAIGPCGLVVRNGDPKALADGLARFLTDEELFTRCRTAARAHLDRHKRKVIGERYRVTLERVASGKSLN